MNCRDQPHALGALEDFDGHAVISERAGQVALAMPRHSAVVIDDFQLRMGREKAGKRRDLSAGVAFENCLAKRGDGRRGPVGRTQEISYNERFDFIR